MLASTYCLCGCLILLIVALVQAAPSNITIEDDASNGSVSEATLLYVGPWSRCPNTNCVIHPDSSQVSDGTWHEVAVDPPSTNPALPYLNLTFTGTALYVFGIVPNTVPDGPSLSTNVTLALDNEPVGSYVHIPSSSSAYAYSIPIYINNSMPSDQYMFSIVVQAGSYFAFDYAIFTSDDSPTGSTPTTGASTPTTSGSNSLQDSSARTTPKTTGAIVGGVVGGVAGVAVLILIVICLRRRSRSHSGSKRAVPVERKIYPFFTEKSPKESSQPSLPAMPTSALLQPNRQLSSPSQQQSVAAPGAITPSSSFIPSESDNNITASAFDSLPMGSSSAGTSTGLTSPSRARYDMAARRLRELAREVQQLEAEVESLRVQPTDADAALTAQVAALQSDMARMRAEQEELRRIVAVDPPPAYENLPEGTASRHGPVRNRTNA